MLTITANLSQSPAAIIRQMLIDLGLGVNPAPDGQTAIPWSVFHSQEPDRPDECITVFTTEGTDDGRSMHDGDLWHHYGFQVRLRSRDDKVGYAKGSLIRNTLAKGVYMRTVSIGTSVYQIQCIAKIRSVLPIGKEASATKRALFTINAVFWCIQTS
jgi:hypothetical protein